jgi:hypothetical protein
MYWGVFSYIQLYSVNSKSSERGNPSPSYDFVKMYTFPFTCDWIQAVRVRNTMYSYVLKCIQLYSVNSKSGGRGNPSPLHDFMKMYTFPFTCDWIQAVRVRNTMYSYVLKCIQLYSVNSKSGGRGNPSPLHDFMKMYTLPFTCDWMQKVSVRNTMYSYVFKCIQLYLVNSKSSERGNPSPSYDFVKMYTFPFTCNWIQKVSVRNTMYWDLLKCVQLYSVNSESSKRGNPSPLHDFVKMYTFPFTCDWIQAVRVRNTMYSNVLKCI